MNGYNFTAETRRALQAARAAADKFQHEYIGTEHILLGVIDDRSNTAVATLTSLGCDIGAIQSMVEAVIKPGKEITLAAAERPYSTRAKKVLELAMICAREDSTPVGTQQLLLGLLREKNGIGGQVLVDAGATLSDVSAAVAKG